MAANGPFRNKPPRKRDRGRRLGAPPPKESWCWQTKAMRNSPAWRELIRHKAAHLVVERVIDEYLEHAGQDNGRLIVTYGNFRTDCGLSDHSIPEGIDIAEALKFLIVHRGRKSKKDRRNPNRYGLTFYPIYEEFETNDWSRIQTRAQARAIVRPIREHYKAERARRKAGRVMAAPSIAPEMGEEQDAAEAVRTGTSGD
jgi:hypothetical protein